MVNDTTFKKKDALVVFSGGQDSTTCLFWARERFRSVEAMSFAYGQRHRVELESASQICKKFGFAHRELPLSGFAELGGNALMAQMPVEGKGPLGLPNTFVPGRNLIFLTYAAAYGYQKGIHDIVTGVCETDFSGYPDCRADTMIALERTLQLGIEIPVKIHTPLMNLSKKETVELARDVGALEALAFTHTCYEGQFPPCGECPACRLRAKGFLDAGVVDPLLARSHSI
ncbi:MAG: 7-cyano-7-deazaguanine synthase QueC [Bdellovibrionales bacterium]|nr:7-cyano-7-deazaguanine synthase QueC [Bdellovibrionales bacterium]